MNIIHIGNFTTGWDSSICDELHISNALNDLGHNVVNIQREQWQERLTEDERGIWHPHPSFILLAQWDGFSEDFIAKIRDCYDTTPIIYWCYDYQDQNQEWHNRLANEADLYLSKRIADGYKYPNWRWLSQDFAPPFLDRIEGVEKDIDVLFTGSYLPWATERLNTLKAVDEKFNLEIHSIMPQQWTDAGFKNSQGPVMDDALPALYARAKVILSIDHTIEAGYWSDRNAQIMCCGGFVLSRYVPMMEATFHNYIDYFYDVEDCLDNIERLLNRPQEDLTLECLMSHNYAQQNLKVDNRVQDLLTIVRSVL